MPTEMRRKKQQLTHEECLNILDNATYGVLALHDSDYPYTIPINYSYSDNCLWFHCAKTGHKLELIAQNPSASFCVVGNSRVIPETLSTYYDSVNVFGEIVVHTKSHQKEHALRLLTDRLAPGLEVISEKEIVQELPAVVTFHLEIESLTGKASRHRIEDLR